MTSKNKMTDRGSHPAAKLGEALTRANGILAVLSQCYDGDREKFAVTDAFLIQSVAAIETFVHEAQGSFSELNLRYDLTPDQALPVRSAAPFPAVPVSPRYVIASTTEEADIFDHVSSDEAAINISATAPPAADARAQSYDELLRKLTAAEVFAQEQQSQTDPNSNSPLLPLLRSLKEDLKKVRAA